MIRISNLIPAKSSTTPCIPVEQMVVGVTSSKSHVSTQLQIQQCQASTFLHRISLNYVPSPFKNFFVQVMGRRSFAFLAHQLLLPPLSLPRPAPLRRPVSLSFPMVQPSAACPLQHSVDTDVYMDLCFFFCVLAFASPCTPALHTGTLRKPSSFNQGGCSTVSVIFSHHQLGYYMV